jgi:class 3 adenylate cyclase/tetratricopeptide (TPR) repeat protein
MTCEVCGHDNAAGARFCTQCGNVLPRACHVCGQPVPAGARFCPNCGAPQPTGPDPDDGEPPTPSGTPADATRPAVPAEDALDLARYVPAPLLDKIRAARDLGAMRGERRTVTMLFADIQGSTAAAEHLDPEDWADIVNGAFTQLIAPVYRYEGTLARLQGDAILAFFGAPIAHEDDPIRAVHAALAMLDAVRDYADEVRERTGVPIAIRIGINTGLVVVGEVGSDLRVEYTALGDAINVAARMEQTAEPGTVRITADTAQLLGETFTTTVLGPVEVKGRAEPVTALRVDGLAPVSHEHAGRAALVGRETELAALAGVLTRLETGIGGVVTLVGEAGIGKSRLLGALREDAARRWPVAGTAAASGTLAWLEGHCRSFESGVPYAVFLDLARRWLEIDDLADPDAYERITSLVAEIDAPHDPDLATYLANVGGTPLPDEARALVEELEAPVLHGKTTDAIVEYFELEARRRPLVIVLDDLHWADALSLELAERMIEAVERSPIMLVLSLRPVRDEPAWRVVEQATREAAHRQLAIELRALDEDAVERLLDELAIDRPLAADERDTLRRRADGNPLFLEELVRTVVDGADELPTSLSGMLSARLDRLDEDARLVAEVAAVVGDEFGPQVVASLVDHVDLGKVLPRLVREGVLVERRRIPEALFAFRHALIQEAAYRMVLLKDRRALHGRIAEHLIAAGADQPHEIARHFLDSDTPERAFGPLVEAASRAKRAMALAEAIRLFVLALEHVPADADPDVLARAQLELGESYSLVPDLDQAAAAYQSVAELGRQIGQPSMEVRALNRMGMAAASIGADYTRALEYLEQARLVAEQAGDEAGLAEYHMNACFVAVGQGEVEQALRHDEETARLGEATGSASVRAAGLVRRALNLVSAGSLTEVDDALAEARQAAEAAGGGEALGLLQGMVEGQVARYQGRLDDAVDLLAAGGTTLERYGSFYTSVVQIAGARVALELGDVEGAYSLLAKARRGAEHRGQDFFVGTAAATLALCDAIIGDDEAHDLHRRETLASIGVPAGGFMASSVWADLASAGIVRGAWRQAEEDAAVGLEASSASRFLERPRLLLAAGRAALELGDPARAAALVDEARDYAVERRLELYGPAVAELAGRIATAAGETARAESLLADAARGAEQFGLRLLAIEVADLRASIADDTAAAARRAERDAHVDAVLDRIAEPELRSQLEGRLRAGAGMGD